MKPLLLTFDVEEFDWPAVDSKQLPIAEQTELTAEGLRLLLPLLAKQWVSATFFITGTFAEGHPDLVRDIADSGHEAAVHGLEHGDDYATLNPGDATKRLQRAREIVEAASGKPAAGLRTPRLRPCPPAAVREAGFLYDASPHPTWMPGRYFGLHLQRSPWREDGITKVPISVVPFVRWPVSWQWFQLVGGHLGLAGARLALSGAPYLHLYFHPWEAVALNRIGVSSPITRRTGAAFVDAIDHLLGWADGSLKAMTISEYLASIEA